MATKTAAQIDLIKNGIKVTTMFELKKALAPFMPDAADDTAITIETTAKDLKISDDSTIDKNSTIKASFGSSSKRTLLIQGLEMLKRRRHLADQLNIEDDDELFGGFKPVSVSAASGYSWVDTMIRRCLDGKRRADDTIEWHLKDGTFVFNPYTGELTREPARTED